MYYLCNLINIYNFKGGEKMVMSGMKVCLEK
jgi:hypothetical protein